MKWGGRKRTNERKKTNEHRFALNLLHRYFYFALENIMPLEYSIANNYSCCIMNVNACGYRLFGKSSNEIVKWLIHTHMRCEKQNDENKQKWEHICSSMTDAKTG